MSESIQIKILLGHSAQWRKKPTPEGFTHDWKMVVQGEEGQEIRHFVEKVVFHLHESFPRPKRVFKEPPYEVAESGYGSFMLPIEVFFRNKEEPRKVLFEYDLVLPNLHDPPINEVRSECLTFQNPSEEFKKKLLVAGAKGTGVDGGNLQIPKKKKHQGDNAGSEPPKKKKKKDSSSDSQSSSGEDSESNEVAAIKKGVKEETGITWDATNLKQLHKQLNAIQDPNQLQEIVNIVESTQIYQLTASTFDFDLCKLDEATLNKLHTLVESFS